LQTGAPLTERERQNLAMPENLREENAPPVGGWEREGLEMGRSVWMGIMKRRKQTECVNNFETSR